MIGIIIGILLFLFLVFIHELGHFWTAKKAGVHVKEFGLGIPPRVVTLFKDKTGTKYTLNRIPLGGFVRLKGEDPEHEDFLATDSFISASLPWKLIILAGGVIMNLLFARLIFSFVFIQGVMPVTVVPDNMLKEEVHSYLMPTVSFLDQQGLLSGNVQEIPVSITNVFPDSLAAEHVLEVGDVISHVDGERVTNKNFGSFLRERIGQSVELSIQRDEGNLTKYISCPEDQCLLGVAIESGGQQEVLPIKMPAAQAFGAGWKEIVAQSKLTLSVLGNYEEICFLSIERRYLNQ